MFDKNYKIDDLMEFEQKYMLNAHPLRKVRFSYGEASKLVTPCSKQFIDFDSGGGKNILGHGHPKLLEDIAKQTRDLMGLSDEYLIEPEVLLAKKIIEISGYENMKLCFGNSKREMNTYAIKLAREFGKKTNRHKIVALGDLNLDFCEEVLEAKSVDEIFNLIDGNVCGVFVEIVPQGEDVFAHYGQKIAQLAKTLKEKNILLMVDESQSGIYALGEIFASKIFGIAPDILVVAGGLGGGLPVVALMCGVKDTCFSYANDFGGSFVNARAGLSVLGILEEEYKNGNLAKSIERFNAQLDGIVQTFPNLFEKKIGAGLRSGLLAKSSQISQKVVENAFEELLLLPKETKNILRFLPALNIGVDELREGFDRLYKACEKI